MIKMSPKSPFLSLPPEIRTQIYKSALAPTGTLTLRRSATGHFTTNPKISPSLLATNRQIHSEASQVLYNGNTICIAVNPNDSTQPIIAEARFPQHLLEKLEHLFVILDYVPAELSPGTLEKALDNTPLDVLMSLKTLQLGMVVLRNKGVIATDRVLAPADQHLIMCKMILSRLPGDVEVKGGGTMLPGSVEEAFTEEMLAARRLAVTNVQRLKEEQIGQGWKMAMEHWNLARGSLSDDGGDDVFASHQERGWRSDQAVYRFPRCGGLHLEPDFMS